MTIFRQTPIFLLVLLLLTIWTSDINNKRITTYVNGLETYTSNLSLRSASGKNNNNRLLKSRQLQGGEKCKDADECQPADMTIVYDFMKKIGNLLDGDDKNSFDTSSVMDDLTNEVNTVFQKSDQEIQALDTGSNLLQTYIASLFYVSQKRVTAQQLSITDYIIGLLEIVVLLIDALSGVLSIWKPESGSIDILDTISIVLSTLLAVLGIILTFVGLLARNVLNILTLSTKQISDISDIITVIDGVFDNVSCSVNSLQCQIDVIQG